MGGGDALQPWWLAIGIGIATALAGTIGKLWAALSAERAGRASDAEAARAELAEAHDQILQLQEQAAARSDQHQREHRRDLRRLAGLPTSMDPGPPQRLELGPLELPVVVRPPLPPRRTPRKKSDD